MFAKPHNTYIGRSLFVAFRGYSIPELRWKQKTWAFTFSGFSLELHKLIFQQITKSKHRNPISLWIPVFCWNCETLLWMISGFTLEGHSIPELHWKSQTSKWGVFLGG